MTAQCRRFWNQLLASSDRKNVCILGWCDPLCALSCLSLCPVEIVSCGLRSFLCSSCLDFALSVYTTVKFVSIQGKYGGASISCQATLYTSKQGPNKPLPMAAVAHSTSCPARNLSHLSVCQDKAVSMREVKLFQGASARCTTGGAKSSDKKLYVRCTVQMFACLSKW